MLSPSLIFSPTLKGPRELEASRVHFPTSALVEGVDPLQGMEVWKLQCLVAITHVIVKFNFEFLRIKWKMESGEEPIVKLRFCFFAFPPAISECLVAEGRRGMLLRVLATQQAKVEVVSETEEAVPADPTLLKV